MQRFLGIKIVRAKPMTRLAYNTLRNWVVHDDENPADRGYLVEYEDGGRANHPDFEGYISWSPLDVFLNAYKPLTDGVQFGDAINALKLGARVARAGWNGKGMWLQLVPAAKYDVIFGICADNKLLPWIGMKTADDCFVPWLASQTDILAEDWVLL